jgi:hypothetical protein
VLNQLKGLKGAEFDEAIDEVLAKLGHVSSTNASRPIPQTPSHDVMLDTGAAVYQGQDSPTQLVPPFAAPSCSTQILADAAYELLLQQECTSSERTYLLLKFFNIALTPNLHHLRPSDPRFRLKDVFAAQPERFRLTVDNQAVYAIPPAPPSPQTASRHAVPTTSSDDDVTNPLERFARAAYRFCVLHGHNTAENAVDGGALCNSTRTPNLLVERIQLESMFPPSQHKGLVRSAFSCIPAAFTFVDQHKLYANPAFSADVTNTFTACITNGGNQSRQPAYANPSASRYTPPAFCGAAPSWSAQFLADAAYELLLQQGCTSSEQTYLLSKFFNIVSRPNLYHLRPSDPRFRLSDVFAAQPERGSASQTSTTLDAILPAPRASQDIDPKAELGFCNDVEAALLAVPNRTMNMSAMGSIVQNPYGTAAAIRKGNGRTSKIILEQDVRRRFVVCVDAAVPDYVALRHAAAAHTAAVVGSPHAGQHLHLARNFSLPSHGILPLPRALPTTSHHAPPKWPTQGLGYAVGGQAVRDFPSPQSPMQSPSESGALSRSMQILADAAYELLVQQGCTRSDRTYPLAFFFNSSLNPNLHHLRPSDLRFRLSDLLSLQPQRFSFVEPGRLAVYAIFPAPLQSLPLQSVPWQSVPLQLAPLVTQLSFDAAPSDLDGSSADDVASHSSITNLPKVQYEKEFCDEVHAVFSKEKDVEVPFHTIADRISLPGRATMAECLDILHKDSRFKVKSFELGVVYVFSTTTKICDVLKSSGLMHLLRWLHGF